VLVLMFAALAAGLVVVLVLTAPAPLPEYPALGEVEDPGLQGVLAYVAADARDADGELGRRCAYTVDLATGVSVDVTCGDSIGFALGWTEDGRLVVEDHDAVQHRDPHFGRGLLLIDPLGSNESETVAWEGRPETFWPDDLERREDGAVVNAETDGRGVVIRHRDGSTESLLPTDEALSGYRVTDVQWSPDGEYVVVLDSVGRVIVAASEGESRPRVILADHGPELNVAWYVEGTNRHTIPLAALVPH
jgi:dipeptidyl aminopeptidase/acylaminoacyl peptidase